MMLKILMSITEISKFHDWLESEHQNGYYFEANRRLVPGNNNTFFYKPVNKEITEGHVFVHAYNRLENGKLIATEQYLEIPLMLHQNDQAHCLESLAQNS